MLPGCLTAETVAEAADPGRASPEPGTRCMASHTLHGVSDRAPVPLWCPGEGGRGTQGPGAGPRLQGLLCSVCERKSPLDVMSQEKRIRTRSGNGLETRFPACGLTEPVCLRMPPKDTQPTATGTGPSPPPRDPRRGVGTEAERGLPCHPLRVWGIYCPRHAPLSLAAVPESVRNWVSAVPLFSCVFLSKGGFQDSRDAPTSWSQRRGDWCRPGRADRLPGPGRTPGIPGAL